MSKDDARHARNYDTQPESTNEVLARWATLVALGALLCLGAVALGIVIFGTVHYS
jgi:hypothetical protein